MKRHLSCALLALLAFLCACGDGSRKPSTPIITVSMTPATAQTIVQGQQINFSVTMTNDSAQKGVTWSATGAGCTAAACGTFTNITGTAATYNAPATVSANLTVSVVATAVADTARSSSVSITVVPAPSISTNALPGGTQGVAYGPTTLAAVGGIAPRTWSVSAGTLPAGLTLNGTTGVISGTPTAIESANFTIRVADASTPPFTATKDLSITIAPAPLVITTTSLAAGAVNANYSATLAASGGTAPISWAVTTGALPAGLTLHAATGVIDGAPTSAETASFTVTATDSASTPQTASKALSVVVNPVLTITTASLPDGIANTVYSTTLTSAGGTAPITWSVTVGALPAGLALNGASAVISGTPTAPGTSNFTIHAVDSSTPQQTADFATSMSITVAPLAISTSSLPNGTIGSAYSSTLQATGGTPPITWSVTVGSLPTWASLDPATGAITGTPNGSPTTTNFTVSATDSASPVQTQTKALGITTVSGGVNNAELNGHYAFTAKGFTAAGDAATMAGSFTADGAGSITGGVIDVNNNPGTTQTDVAITGGSYSIGADQRGKLSLTTATSTLQFVFSLGGLSGGIATKGHIVTADTTVASGILRKQDPAVFGNASITGTFIAALNGEERAGGRQAALAAVTFDGAGGFTATMDANDAGITSTNPFNGTYNVADATNGRVLFNDTTNGSHMAVYVVSATEVLMINIDASGPPIFIGTAVKQSGTFSDASLNRVSIVAVQALGTGPRADLDVFTPDGAGSYTLVQDTNRGGTFTAATSQNGTYSVSPTGKVTIPGGPILYLSSANTGFLMGTDNKVEFGFLEPQTGGPFTNSSVTGNYFFGNDSPIVPGSGLSCGVVTGDGSGGLTGTNDDNFGGTITTTPITETLTISSDGRITTTGAVMHIISPTKALLMDTTSTTPVITVVEK